MKADAALKDDKTNIREIVTCSRCDRVLTNPKESVRSRKQVICVSCYESLLNPFQKSCCSGAAI
jgi:formylmethanofuran dehydrogenase subunit E